MGELAKWLSLLICSCLKFIKSALHLADNGASTNNALENRLSERQDRARAASLTTGIEDSDRGGMQFARAASLATSIEFERGDIQFALATSLTTGVDLSRGKRVHCKVHGMAVTC